MVNSFLGVKGFRINDKYKYERINAEDIFKAVMALVNFVFILFLIFKQKDNLSENITYLRCCNMLYIYKK